MSIITPVTTTAIAIADTVFQAMICFGEEGYPEEVAGFLLGTALAGGVAVQSFLPVANQREMEARSHRYKISPDDWQRGEKEAKCLNMNIVGVFHTHPDHVSTPSTYDLEFALPNFVYLIAAIHQGKLATIDAWKLQEDRSGFDNCFIHGPCIDLVNDQSPEV